MASEKYISYIIDGELYDVPESESATFEERNPNAAIEMHIGNEMFDVPLSEKDNFLKRNGSAATYSFDLSEEESTSSADSQKTDDKASWGETAVKGLGAAGVRTAKLALDLGRMAWNTSVLGGAANKIKQWNNPEYGTMDERLRDEDNAVTKASMKLGEVADRLSKEADPTGGEKGFTQLIREGKIGQVAQKALGSGLESLPMMIAAGTGWGALLYGAGMAAGEYSDETRENPEIASWKRGIKSLGSAALEMAVEKIGGPLKNIGSAGKNITEEMAKEILETAVKEGTENTAKRIIKKIGKQGLEEGGEELLTSFGNDALGQALDWIDGNADYGITAQWEKMKEENPDASIKDFAWSKAEEYMDSFIGGAVSGMEISSTVEGANYLANRGNVMDAARNYGADKSYGDMYDMDSEVATAKEAIASAFTNQDGEQTVSNDFIDGLTADDAFALSSREELSGEQRRAFRQLALKKATQDGLTQKLDEELENRISTQKAKLEAASDNGNLVAGMVGDKAMYIKGGIVKDGRVFVNEEGASGPVIVVDPKTGEETTVNSGDITAAIAKDAATEIATFETNAREYEAQIREKSRTTMSAKAKYNAVKPLEGKKLMVDLGNGIIEVKIQQVLPESGEVLVKGKKGDLDGQSNIKIGVGAFYDSIYRDDDGNPIITEGESELDVATPEVEEPTTETIDEPIEITGEEDFRDYSGPMLINGVPTNVAVQSQDDATDSVVYTYTDENGNTQRGTATVREFAEAVQKARPTNTEPAPQPAPAPAPAPTDEPIEEPISNGPVVEVPVTPQTIDWDVLFEQDPEGYFAEMQNQFGDKTAKRLNAIIAATQKRLDALNKANPQTDNEILENEEKKEKLEAKIASLNDMVARLTAPVVEEVVEPETPEVPETPAPVAEEPAEPEAPVAEPVVDEPAEPETPVVEEPAPAPKPVEQKPVAPNPVADPVSEAQKIEKELRGKLDRVGIPRETKQDWARRAGKRVGDLFATREEYGAYEAIAEDLGEYLAFFEGGVEESFAKRSNIESGSPEVSVPLTEKPKESNNGETGESAEGRPYGTDSGRSSDEGDAKGDSGDAQTESERGNKGKGSKAGEQVNKYPARKGNATQKLLVDTFGFNSVTIPNTRKSTLNAIYDFMMEMSKMLGISPKSIGQGGWLSVGNLRSNAHFAAVHEMRSGSVTGKIADVSLKFKYDALTGIAHEWFHALDYALEYFDSGVRRPTTSEIDRSKFSGRKEVWDAVDNIVKAINESGHPERIKKLVRNISAWSYWLSPKEMCARAFDEYILNKFREAGIQIEGTFDEKNNGNPTPEEMAVIAPAFDNLFKVLKEKDGKTPGSSVLYRIEGEEFTPTELQQEVAKYVVKWITDAGYTVHTDINELQEAISRSESEKTQFLRTDDGVIYGLVQNGEIYLDPALLNPNTPIHEYTHIWDMIIMEQNPQLWEEGKKLLKQLDLWNEIANSEQYKSLRGDEDLIASEVHSRLVGEKGEEVFTKLYERASGHANETGIELSLIIRIKNWIRQIMENIKSIILPYSSDKSVSLQEFVSMPLNDLVFNARPRNRYTETYRLDWGEQPANALSEFATLPRININEFNGHAQQYYSELENGIGYVVYDGSVYIFDIDSYGLARPIIKFKSYEEARRRVDVFNRRNISGHNSYLGTKRDKTTANIYNNSSNGIRGASENVPPVVEGESGSKERLGIGRQNNETEYSVRGSSVDSDGLLFRKEDIQNAAVDYLVGDPRLRAIENAVNEEASKLGVTVTYKTRSEMPKGHENDKGYFNTKTGEIVICTENAASIADAIQTILHESVAHKGLRQLMGDKFNEFINRVYNSLDAETKAKVDALATEHYNGNTAVAMEEYMASLAETEDFANNSVWEKIKSIFEDIINTILGRNDIKIGDNELRYILRASYNNMVNPKNMDSVRGWAQDQMMREEYKINEATPEILSRTGITPTEVASESARETYNRVVSEGWQEFQRQFQDAMQPMRIAIEAIQQETGNMPVEDYENFLLMWNQISSRSRVEIDNFARRYYDPIFKQVQEIIDQILESRGENKKDESKRAEVYAEIRQYMFAKHGLERNLYYQANKTRKLKQSEKNKAKAEAQKEYDEKINAINADTILTDAERELQLRDAKDAFDAALLEIETREVPDMRDYSGLTALFGMDDFKKAEAEAQKVIDEFESKIGKSADKLWEKINKATDKTLRHSYESGLISRQQYNEIKGMFKFYIPLRGFDETTAEDVYSYARFEGNKFNPAVQTAKGRTSLADDPLAIIMNMAESEIAQGNKNRAKQALYNFILNRTITDENGNQRQNSLMQVESVWYIKNEDKDGNAYYTIATPNHSEGETYEEFEAEMNALAAEDKAYKSKKGNVDVGMRFQKPTNANAHYIYLKVNGVEKAIYINGDPKAAEAVNGTRKPKTMFGEEKMRAANRILSSTFTNYSLEFTARNYFRDMIYSHINIGIRESDPEYRKKFRQNWRHNNLGTMMKLLKAYRAGELEGRALTEDEAAFVEFMNAGGQTGYTLINSVENHKKDLERAIKNMQKGLEHGGVKDSAVFKATLGGIELLNESSELVTRFAAFKTSRDMGRSVVKSVSDAKEVTVNFNTKGAQDGKGWMGWIANYLGLSKFFFNASVQGVQNIKGMADANKLRFCGTVGGVMAFGFFMPIITSSIAAILGADDDEEEYWNIPEHDRQNNFCIPVGGGKYVKIPLPIGFREVYALGDMVAAMAFNKKFTRDVEQVGIDMANKIASVVLPINPLESTANGLSVWHSLLNITLPSSIQFAVQNMANIDWKGAPLQKEYTYNANDPQWMKAYSSNPDWMVCLSKWCNEHIGVGDMKGLDWSPEKLDNTLSNLFGGIYTLVKKTGKSFSMIWNEENRNLSNVPLSGVVLGSGMDKDDRFVTDVYYEEKGYYDDRIQFIETRAEKFGLTLNDVFVYEKGKHHPKMMEVYNNKEFDFMQEWYKGNKRLEKLNDEIKEFEKEIAKHSDPSEGMLNRLAEMKDRLAVEKREFVEDILELD